MWRPEWLKRMDPRIFIGSQALREADGVRIEIFNPKDHPYRGYGGRERFDLANMRGRISIQDRSRAGEAFETAREAQKKAEGRVDGNYVNFSIFYRGQELLVNEGGWNFDREHGITTYNLF